MTLPYAKKIFFLSGNLKKGKGRIEGTFPSCYNEPESYKSDWQINVSFISFINNIDLQLNDLLLVSTNLIRDHKINNSGETEVWNPYILHLHFNGKSNSLSFGQNNFLTLSSFSSTIAFTFTDMKTNNLYSQAVEIKITIILERKFY